MQKSRRSWNKSTAQIGRGDGAPNFELVRPPEDNFFQLEVIQSKSFIQFCKKPKGIMSMQV